MLGANFGPLLYGDVPVMVKNRRSSKHFIFHGVHRRMISVVNFFVFLRLLFLLCCCYINDLVHDVETIFHLSYVLTASVKLF